MYAAPWCYHCNLMRPNWVAAAQAVGKDSTANVRFGLVDADGNRGLSRRFNVQKLPTLKFYQAGYGKNDDNVQDYNGGRTQKDLVEFSYALLGEYRANPEKYAYTGQSMVAKLHVKEQPDSSSSLPS